MTISLRFELDFHTSSDHANEWRSERLSSRPDGDMDDPFDIREGGQNWRDTNIYRKTDGKSNDKDINDAQALADFIAMVLAVIAHAIGKHFPPSPEPEQKRCTGLDSSRHVRPYTGDDNRGDDSPGRFKPVTNARLDERGDITDGNQRVPSDQKTPVNKQISPPDKSGISPDSSKLVSTGTGTGHYFNVTNKTDREQTFAFSSNSSNTSGYSNKINAVMTLKPGETGTFEAGDNVPGIRINTSGPKGETHGNETLYEDSIEPNPMGGGIVHNPDVSKVAGKLSYDGRRQRITVNDGTRSIGDGTETGVYDYDVEDKDPNRATNPMNMALNPARSYSIVFSDG